MYPLSRLAVVLGTASLAFAQNIIPFAVDGSLDNCTPGTEYNSGGTISVGGFTITVPKNLIAQFPVVWVPFKQMCEAGVLSYEVAVSGNVIDGKPIAAQIQVGSPHHLEGAQGVIETVEIGANGYLQIKGGPKVRINDPNAVFSAGLKQKELFQADSGSPSITAFSGFPMCIPRGTTDDKCPSENRPANQRSFRAPKPLAMAPFREGDFIEYSGLKVGESEVLAWAITAINVQITTQASDTEPQYIRVEEGLIGVFDTGNNIEVADIRFIGFLSSCAGSTVTISAIDVDPCTGKESYRQIGTATPKNGDARCKWEFRADTTAQSTYTREYLIKTNAAVIDLKNGIMAGQYVQPVNEWIQAEVDVPGTEPPPYRFRDIRGLVQGDFLDGKQYGPLEPFPGPAPPAPSKTCSPSDIPTGEEPPPTDPGSPGEQPASTAPIASAAQISTAQRQGTQIFLSGSNTAQGIEASNLVFEWTKTSPSSPSVSIQNAAQPTATLTLPQVGTETEFTFQLKISLQSDSSKSSTATVKFKVSPTLADVVTLDTYTWQSRQSGTISVSCHSNVINGENTKMELHLNNGGVKLNMVKGAGPGQWTYTARGRSRPTNVRCVSNLRGQSALVTTTTSRRKRGELGRDMVSWAEW